MTSVLASLANADPRLSTEYVRFLPGDDETEGVLLVGVAHDHPASVHRVRTIVDALDPDALALEVPDLLVPVLEQHAADGLAAGGEMTAAIEAAQTPEIVGIDAPSLRAARSIVAELGREAESATTVTAALRNLGQITADAVRKRFRVGRRASPEPGDPEHAGRYDCTSGDPAEEQASHEAAHIRRSTALLGALDAPPANQILDVARERAMRTHLTDLRQSAFVVGVVGYGHLDAIADGL